MTVIPFPRRFVPPKEVAEFKRVCDDVGLELRDEPKMTEAALDQMAHDLGWRPAEPKKPPLEDV